MRLSFRGVLLLGASLALGGCGIAQTSAPKPPAGTRPSFKRFCQPEGGFCFSYPAAWRVLGEGFSGGIIIAPEQKEERAMWDEITVATVVPAPEESQSAHTINDVIGAATANMQKDGRDPQTLQRQERTVDGLPAQMIRLQYHDDEQRTWIEELVFIEGPQQEIYSVALKAQPLTIARMEPAFSGILRSWRLRASTAPPAPAAATTPHSKSPTEKH